MSEPSRIALITGGARRIGRVLARRFAADGWDVAIHFRSSGADAEALASEISATGTNAAAIQADLASVSDVRGLVDQCKDMLGPPICLINNASDFQFDSVQTLTEESWSRHVDVNLKAPVFLAQAMVANLPAGVQGNIINIIDQRVWRLTPEFFSYTVSKAGLWSATRMMAQALAPHVRVNAIGPGPVLQSIHQTPDDFAKEAASTPLGRGTSPDEIADAIRFILDAPAMTGQMIALDGGQHLDWSGAESPAALVSEASGSAT